MKLIIQFLFLLVCNYTLVANEQITNNTPIHTPEIAEELQTNPSSCLDSVLAEFLAKGGTIIRLADDAEPFQLLPNDMVFPACSGGNNRSQTLWNILRPYTNTITLMPPHATQHGFDSYNGQANWLRIKPLQEVDEFEQWAGVSKSKKFGWDLFSHWLTKPEAPAEELLKMTDFYTREYFHPAVSSDTRRVYITFMKNAHIHLFRLNQTNQSLENVVVLLYPLDDLIKHPLPEWNTFPGSKKTYEELSKKLALYLDFRLIK